MTDETEDQTLDFQDADAQFLLSGRDLELLEAMRGLLWRTVRSERVNPLQLGILGRAIDALFRLPGNTEDIDIAVNYRAPGPTTGTRTNSRSWGLTITSDEIYIDTGGYTYDPEVGGDSYSCLNWWCHVGSESSYEDYSSHHAHVVAGLGNPIEELRHLDPNHASVEVSVEDNFE